MVTAFSSPEMIAQKAQVPDITPDPTAPAGPAPLGRLGRDLEPDAGAGPLAEEAPAFGERVDQLETAPVLVVPAGLAPLRQADAPVVDDVHVHDGAETHHGHRHPGRAGG